VADALVDAVEALVGEIEREFVTVPEGELDGEAEGLVDAARTDGEKDAPP
jgi:hypothetical protein